MICSRWEKFENFFADMGARPSKAYCIERSNNNLGYSPENCFWATRKQQANNRRSNRRVTWQGRTQTVQQWAEKLGMNKVTLLDRLNRWSVECALTIPVGKARGPRGPYKKSNHALSL
jgi:hypothetical protein